jgi:hypothetical protein
MPNKSIDQLFKSFCLVGKISSVHADQIKEQLEEFVKQRDEDVSEKIWQMFDLTVDDMPAFPPKEVDKIGLALAIGISKLTTK